MIGRIETPTEDIEVTGSAGSLVFVGGAGSLS